MYLQSGFEFALQLRTIRDSVYLYISFLSKFAATRLKDTVSSLSVCELGNRVASVFLALHKTRFASTVFTAAGSNTQLVASMQNRVLCPKLYCKHVRLMICLTYLYRIHPIAGQ